jgi:hypothetical protein
MPDTHYTRQNAIDDAYLGADFFYRNLKSYIEHEDIFESLYLRAVEPLSEYGKHNFYQGALIASEVINNFFHGDKNAMLYPMNYQTRDQILDNIESRIGFLMVHSAIKLKNGETGTIFIWENSSIVDDQSRLNFLEDFFDFLFGGKNAFANEINPSSPLPPHMPPSKPSPLILDLNGDGLKHQV